MKEIWDMKESELRDRARSIDVMLENEDATPKIAQERIEIRRALEQIRRAKCQY